MIFDNCQMLFCFINERVNVINTLYSTLDDEKMKNIRFIKKIVIPKKYTPSKIMWLEIKKLFKLLNLAGTTSTF